MYYLFDFIKNNFYPELKLDQELSDFLRMYKTEPADIHEPLEGYKVFINKDYYKDVDIFKDDTLIGYINRVPSDFDRGVQYKGFYIDEQFASDQLSLDATKRMIDRILTICLRALTLQKEREAMEHANDVPEEKSNYIVTLNCVIGATDIDAAQKHANMLAKHMSNDYAPIEFTVTSVSRLVPARN